MSYLESRIVQSVYEDMAIDPDIKRGKSHPSNHMNTLQNDSSASVVKATFGCADVVGC
jgi:hypothetical protein